MAGSLLPEPKQQFLNDIGDPLFAGQIFTYAAGTLTPKATYQDQALTIANTNPVVANARGEVVMYGSGNYRVILKDLFGNTIYDRDNIETSDFVANSILSTLSSSSGATLVGFVQPGAGAVATTIFDKSSQYVSFFDYMTSSQRLECVNRTGALDFYAACQATIDATYGPVTMPVGLYPLSQKLIIRNNCTGIIGSDSYTCTFEKRFNGDLISSLQNGAVLTGFGINGNGATYSGGGIVPEGYNSQLEKLRIADTQDSPVIFKAAIGTNVGSGTYSVVRDCFLSPTNPATTCGIRSIGSDDSSRPTCRSFEKLSGGSSLVDFSGMNFCSLTDSLGTLVKFSSTSGKVHMTGNRITASANVDILGVDHVLDENIFGFALGSNVTIGAACSNVRYGPCNSISINGAFGKSPTLNIALGAANPNFIHSELTDYTFGWYGAGGNPTLGNASKYAYYKLSGQQCYATFGITIGSTTVAGIGTYTFQLPFKAFVTSIGSALVKAQGGQYYEGTYIVQGGSSVGVIYLLDGTLTEFTSSSISFGTNAVLYVTINYLVAVS